MWSRSSNNFSSQSSLSPLCALDLHLEIHLLLVQMQHSTVWHPIGPLFFAALFAWPLDFCHLVSKLVSIHPAHIEKLDICSLFVSPVNMARPIIYVSDDIEKIALSVLKCKNSVHEVSTSFNLCQWIKFLSINAHVLSRLGELSFSLFEMADQSDFQPLLLLTLILYHVVHVYRNL